MLRGRGGCYKHTFYGIQSHRCMESTPSLACANKCIFCWRLFLIWFNFDQTSFKSCWNRMEMENG